MGPDTFCFKCWDSIFSYEEPRVVRIRSISLGVIYWGIMLAVLLFIITYLIFYSNGYQQFDPVDGAVTTKLFGVVKPNDTGSSSFRPVWDNADYMVPPKENGAFTVITSVLVTQGQVQSTCDEDPSIRGAQCEVHENCTAEKALLYGNGVMTGLCIGSTHAPDINVCQINAWCPVEINNSSKRMFLASENFTAFIRNNVKFPAFDRKRQNFPDNMDDKELGSCVFDPGHPRNRHCPIFKISTIAQEAGYSFNSMMIEGAVIEIIIKWDCNFDYDDECLPTYSFHRLDRVHHPASRGFHLRYADHYTNQNGQSVRTLYRAYGIRVIVTVHGSGRKFSPFVTAKTVGSGMSYFGFAAFVVSVVLLRLYKMCCKEKCCLEDGSCSCCSCCYKWCCCKPFGKNTRTVQDRHADDLRETTSVFKDACGLSCCVPCGERYREQEPIHQQQNQNVHLDEQEPIHQQQNQNVHLDEQEPIHQQQNQNVHLDEQEPIHQQQNQNVHLDEQEPIHQQQNQNVHLDEQEPIHQQQNQNVHLDEQEPIRQQQNQNVHLDEQEPIRQQQNQNVNLDEQEPIRHQQNQNVNLDEQEPIRHQQNQNVNLDEQEPIRHQQNQNVNLDGPPQNSASEINLRLAKSDWDPIDDADSFGQSDHGGNSSSDPTGASVSYHPDTGVTISL